MPLITVSTIGDIVKIAAALFNHIAISDVVAEVGLKRAADGALILQERSVGDLTLAGDVEDGVGLSLAKNLVTLILGVIQSHVAAQDLTRDVEGLGLAADIPIPTREEDTALDLTADLGPENLTKSAAAEEVSGTRNARLAATREDGVDVTLTRAGAIELYFPQSA